MRFKRNSEGTVEFGSEAAETLNRYKQVSQNAPEAGGMLLGRLIDIGHDVVIDQVSVPKKEDRRWRFFFFRKREPAQKIVNQAWLDSEAVINYLGEWHTHPEDIPSPSSVDIAEWTRITRESHYEQTFLLFAIVGRVSTRVWEISRDSGKLVELAPLD